MAEKIKFSTNQTVRLDEYLRAELHEHPLLKGLSLSNSKIRRLIVSGQVSVNGRSINRPAFELRGKSDVCLFFDLEKFFYEKQPDDIKFEVSQESVLYEDESLIFIDKPADFPVEQTVTGKRANLHDAVVDYLWAKNPKLPNPPYVGIMHRLDRTTSGVILFTKNREVNKKVAEIFQSHAFTKKYYAVVEKGQERLSPGQSFSVEMYMARISSKSQAAKWGRVPQEAKDAQYSRTDFTVLRPITIEKQNCLLLECRLYTGRTHQIRVHLASLGLPILGDTLYGGREASRIYLHSFELSCDLFSVKSEPPWY